MKKKHLIWHVYPSYLLIALASLTCAVAATSHFARRFHYKQTARELSAATRLVSELLPPDLDLADSRVVDKLCDRLGSATGYRITIILQSGVVTGDSQEAPESMDDHGNRPEVVQALREGIGYSKRYSATLHRHMLYVATPHNSTTSESATIRASLARDTINSALSQLWRRIAAVGLIIAILGSLLAVYTSSRISRPLAAMRRSAENFGQGKPYQRLPSSSIAELDLLANTWNQMATHLNERIATVRQQRDQQAALLSCMSEGVLAIDNERRIIRINEAAAELFRVDSEQCRGKLAVETIRNPELLDVIGRTMNSSETVEGSVFLPQGDRHLQAHGTILHGRDSTRFGALIVLNDITRLRRLENMRRDFVANVSHELRTPITSIMGFIDTLRNGAAENKEDLERFLKIVDHHAGRLRSIVEDLLELSRLENVTEKGKIEMQRGRIADAVSNAVETCRPAAATRGIRLQQECPENITAPANAQLIERAVINLIDNAIKYSEDNTQVDITVTNAESTVDIVITDQGPGIAQQHLPHLFERFYRADRGRSRKLGGTGLGLAIVKHVAAVHSGRVSVKSELGCGSCFTISLPQG